MGLDDAGAGGSWIRTLGPLVTTQPGVREKAAVERFETALAAGQSAAISIPRAAGEPPERVVLTNAGGHLQIAEPSAAVSAQ
jgi:hypothetical protein